MGQDDERRAESPAAKAGGSLPGPEDVHREELENGITVLARSNFSSPSVTISGYIRTGSMLDPDPKLGLADFTVSALMRGTRAHSFDELYNALESVGASLGFDSGINTTGFHGHALAEDLPSAGEAVVRVAAGTDLSSERGGKTPAEPAYRA